jgi:hypothetical protein
MRRKSGPEASSRKSSHACAARTGQVCGLDPCGISTRLPCRSWSVLERRSGGQCADAGGVGELGQVKADDGRSGGQRGERGGVSSVSSVLEPSAECTGEHRSVAALRAEGED